MIPLVINLTSILIATALFGLRWWPHPIITSGIYLALFIMNMICCGGTRAGVLPRLYLFAYTASSFMFFEFVVFGKMEVPDIGRLSAKYTSDPFLVNFVMMLHLIGMLALAIGTQVRSRMPSQDSFWGLPMRKRPQPIEFRYLAFPAFFLMIFIPTLLYALVAPRGTILSAGYMAVRVQGGILPMLAFAGVTTVSFLAIATGLFDYRLSSISLRKRVDHARLFVLIFCSLFLIIWVDLLRGNRDTANLVLIWLGFYLAFGFTDPRIQAWLRHRVSQIRRSSVNRRMITVAIASFFLAMIYLSLQFVRERLHYANLDLSGVATALATPYKTGTWMGAFYGSFGLAAEHAEGDEDLLYFEPVTDMLVSMVPSPISRTIGFSRPYDDFKNTPAGWYSFLGRGGCHITILPYKSFGIIGVILALMFIGYIIQSSEFYRNRLTVYRVLIYCAFLECSLRWLWYSYLHPVRSVMAAMIFALLYKIGTSIVGTPMRIGPLDPSKERVESQPNLPRAL